MSVGLLGVPIDADGAPALTLEPCLLHDNARTRSVAARCGQLEVPENYEAPTGRTITLKVAVVEALRKGRSEDAFVPIAGGPGQASTEDYVEWGVAAFANIRKTRDIVLVDQRGTGASNPLRCPTDDADWLNIEPPPEAETIERVKACLASLDGDPRYYTTTIAVRDLDQVRAALGYAQFNVYGVSYGTRVALQYLRTYPDRARTVVLDGVIAADQTLGPEVATAAQRALDLLFERCAQDEGCRKAYPKLKENFQGLRTRLAEDPPEVRFRDPRSGAPSHLRLTEAYLALVIRMLSYSSESTALLPLLIHRAVEDDDLAALAAQATLVARGLGSKIASGLHLAVLCTEDIPFMIDDVQAPKPSTYLGDTVVQGLATACRAWPQGAIADDFKTPVRSDRPVLLLSGEADPVTPPSNAERARQTLSKSRHIVVDDHGHGVARLTCVGRMIQDFVETSSVDAIDDGCLAREAPSPFFLTPSGPAP